jgi:hypothetical protein
MTMGADQRVMLHGLIGFRFKKHSKYNLPPKRLKALDNSIQYMGEKLLEENLLQQD